MARGALSLGCARLPALVAAALIAAGSARAQEPSAPTDGRAAYRAMIETESAKAGIPAEVAEAVLATESGYDAAASGADGEVGLMQVLPSTARMMGFAGSDAELAVPATNIRYGVTYLAGAWRKGGRDLCTAAMKYRAGHGEHRFSHRSVAYCVAIRSKLAARGYQVTGSVPVATFGESAGAIRAAGLGGGCRRSCLKGSGSAAADVAALNARLASLVIAVRVVKLPKR